MKTSLLLLILTFLFQNFSLSQDVDLYSPQNRRLFADYLYCQNDYLRAINEYNAIPDLASNDTILFKIGLAYLKMGKYIDAVSGFAKVNMNSAYYNDSRLEFFKSNFLLGNYDTLSQSADSYLPVKKLSMFSYLLDYKTPPSLDNFLIPFEGNDRIDLSVFYKRKFYPPYKSELTAALLSTIVPGAGKIYTHEYSDGIIAFLVTGIMAYISYTDFKADHNFRGWLFAGLTAFFYGGSIYGSAASAQIYNAQLNFKLNSDMKFFLEGHNYFIPDYEFCK